MGSEEGDDRDELILRENAAKLLARIAENNDDLKYTNLKPHLFELLCKELVIQVDRFDPDSFAIIHAILKVLCSYTVFQLHGQQCHQNLSLGLHF